MKGGITKIIDAVDVEGIGKLPARFDVDFDGVDFVNGKNANGHFGGEHGREQRGYSGICKVIRKT